MIRRAMPGDEVALEGFLARHPAASMFLRGNLAAHGLGPNAHPHAMTYHLFPAEAPIQAVIGLTNGGMVLCQFGTAPEALAALAALAAALDGQDVAGLNGDADQTDALITALGLRPGKDFLLNKVEPLFHLSLANLTGGPEGIRPPKPSEEKLLAGWFRAYMFETGIGEAGAGITAEDRAAAAVSSGAVQILVRDGQPVAMAAINARAAGTVQVGGVFVPPEARNRGLGREVTRALLAEARDQGATDAVLFSNNEAASRAYRSIGFAQVGEYRIAFLHSPQRIGATA